MTYYVALGGRSPSPNWTLAAPGGNLLIFKGASSSILSNRCASLPGKHNSVRADSDRGVSSLLESLGQAIEISRRRRGAAANCFLIRMENYIVLNGVIFLTPQG